MLELLEHRSVVEVRLDRAPVNALNPELLQRLQQHLLDIHERPDDTLAMVLSGQPGMFTAGLDLPELLTCERADMLRFWELFHDVWRLLATCPVPVVAAITGHSPAGGTVMALFCDYRVMAEGDYKLGLNETRVGLVAPRIVHFALQRLVGAHAAERHIVGGQLLDPGRALALGLVDEVVPVEQVVDRALEWCRELAALPRAAMLGNRRIARAGLHELFAGPDDSEAFLDFWFSDATRARLLEVVADLKRGKT